MSSSKRTLVYIMSPSFSGSTLLTRLLSTHREISTIAELKASALGDLDDYRCGCGEMILECQFWKDVVDRVRSKGDDLDLSDWGTQFRSQNAVIDRILRPNYKSAFLEFVRNTAIKVVPGVGSTVKEVLQHNRNIMDAICEIQGGPIFLDDSKDPMRLKYFHDSGIWDIRAISLVRDARGTVNSDQNHNGVTLEQGCRNWNEKMIEIQRLEALLGDRVYKLRYEDLCDDPESILMEILAFLGLPTGDDDLGPEKPHILGNPMRLIPLTDIRLDEKWKTVFSEDQVKKIEASCEALMKHYRYL